MCFVVMLKNKARFWQLGEFPACPTLANVHGMVFLNCREYLCEIITQVSFHAFVNFSTHFVAFFHRRWLNNPHNVSQSQWTVKISCFYCTHLGAQGNQRVWYIHRQGIFCMPSSLIRYDCLTVVLFTCKIFKFPHYKFKSLI